MIPALDMWKSNFQCSFLFIFTESVDSYHKFSSIYFQKMVTVAKHHEFTFSLGVNRTLKTQCEGKI